MNMERLKKQVGRWQKETVLELIDARGIDSDEAADAAAKDPTFTHEVQTKVVYLCVQKYGIGSKETEIVTNWFLKHADPQLLAESFRNSAAKVWKWGHFDLSHQLQGMANDLNGGN